jgi:acetoin utilization deacetylase AcuC-like enzyme
VTLLFSDPVFLEHDTGGHPESPDRLEAVHQALQTTGLMQRVEHGTIRPAQRAELARVHDEDYINTIEEYARQVQGPTAIEADTVVCPRSFDVAVQAAGTALAAVDEVLGGRHKRAVCLTRPPGHHALPDRAMGFCLFNNVALAARHAQAVHAVSRVLIVDWDVHHGNGTQDIFYADGSVCFYSVHRFPFYPGTGRESETGMGDGLGWTFNLPLAFGISRRDYLERFQEMLERAADHSRPELVLVSAGFDAHAADPIGSLGLESEDFGALTKLVMDIADQHCDGRLISLLEGGYNVQALAESVCCHVEELMSRK